MNLYIYNYLHINKKNQLVLGKVSPSFSNEIRYNPIKMSLIFIQGLRGMS